MRCEPAGRIARQRTQGGRGLKDRRRSSRFWGPGCPKIFHEIEDSPEFFALVTKLLDTYDRTGKRAIGAEFAHLPAVSPLADGKFGAWLYNSETGYLLPISTKHVSGYVADPTLPMRVWPTQQAESNSVLKIGEPVKVLSSHGRWVQVQSRLDYSRGWVRKAGIAKSKPSVKTLRIALSKEKRPGARRRTLAAMLALSPYDLPALREYAELLKDETVKGPYKSIEKRIHYIVDPTVRRQPNEPRYIFLSTAGTDIDPLAIENTGTGVSVKYNVNKLLRDEFHVGRKLWLYSNTKKLGVAIVTKGEQPGDVSQSGCTSGNSATVAPVGIDEPKLAGFLIASNYPLNVIPHHRVKHLAKRDVKCFRQLALKLVRAYVGDLGEKSGIRLDDSYHAEQVVYGHFARTSHETAAYLADFKRLGHRDAGYYAVIIAERNSSGRWQKLYSHVRGGGGSATAMVYPPYGALDVTGDGIDELFYSAGYYEWSGAHILSFRDGTWRDLFAYGGGC